MGLWARLSNVLECVARRGATAGASVVLVAVLASCQGTGGTPPIPYEQLRGNLDRAYASVEQTIDAGSFDQVPSYCDALSREFDGIEEATKGWGFLEREKMKLQIATARRGLQTVVRAAPASGDVQLLKDQLRPLGESVHEVSALLAQAAASAAARTSP
jgi:hypothetical protein